MRSAKGRLALVALVAGVLAVGCAGDLSKQVMSNPELQGKIMDMIAASAPTAGGMADRLLSSDSTRAMVVDKLVASAGGAQVVMETVAKNQALLDGALNAAMQDPTMKDHVLTLFKGMRMAGAK